MIVILASEEGLGNLGQFGVNGDTLVPEKTPSDVRETAEQLGCFGFILAIRDERDGRAYVGVRGNDDRKTETDLPRLSS